MIIIIWGVALSSLGLIVVLLLSSQTGGRVEERLQEVSQHAMPRMLNTEAGLIVPPSAPVHVDNTAIRRAREDQRKLTLRDRLVQAGLYKDRSGVVFGLAKVLLALVPIGLGVTAGLTGAAPLLPAVVVGGALSAFGTIAPSFWLDHLKANRQKRIRRALPDALDVIVVCLEGGLSLTAAFTRVARELADAHQLLALELKIVEREVQMGRSTGEAMRNFAKRFDMEELRSMAAVIIQAERFGSSVVKALTIYADTMRERRQQRAEEMAHKAVVKIIFPTVLCIFPAIFVVILGPAAIQIYEVISSGALMSQ